MLEEIDSTVILMSALVIPVLLFIWKMASMIKRTHDMHHAPDEHGFGTETTNKLLLQHMEEESEMHRESLDSLKLLRHTIRELSHYTRWAAEQSVGKKPPPYVRRNGD